MHIQKINNIKTNYVLVTHNKKNQSIPTFKGVQEIEDSYDKKINKLSWFQKNFTNKQKQLISQKNAEILGYAKAQEEARNELIKNCEEIKKSLEIAQKNKASENEIANLKEKVKEAENLMRIQTELIKVKNNKGWDKIAGYDSEKSILTSEFIQTIGLEKSGQDVALPNGILFFGPTGNGKTTFAQAFAEQAQCPLIEVDAFSQNDFKRDLENALNESKKNYSKNKIRSIILIDEFEKYGLDGEKGGNKALVASLKTVMQSCADKYKATLFLTTNNPQDIEPILLVDSRVPIRVFLDPPDRINADRVVNYYLNGKTTNYINTNNIVDELFENQQNGAYSNSRIKTIIESCFKEAMKAKRILTEGDIINKIKETLPDIKKAHLAKYKEDVKAIVGTIK